MSGLVLQLRHSHYAEDIYPIVDEQGQVTEEEIDKLLRYEVGVRYASQSRYLLPRTASFRTHSKRTGTRPRDRKGVRYYNTTR